MKTLNTLSTLVGLIFGLSSTSSLWACDYGSDPDLAQQQQTCLTKKGMRWDCERNRCVHNPNDPTVAAQAEYEACASIADPAGRQACHDEYAKQKAAVGAAEVKSSGGMALGVNAAFAAISGINMMGAMGGGGGGGMGCTSRMLFTATAVGGTLQEVAFKDDSKKKLDNLRDQHAQQVASGDAYSDQLRAFDYLKREQEIVKQGSEKKKGQYNMLFMGYGASGALAAAETFGLMGMQPCPSTGGIGMLGSSKAIMVMSLVGAGLSKKLADGAGKQAEEAEENIKKIDAVMAQFKNSGPSECAGHRDNMALPQCYCFTLDNRPVQDRKDTDICKNFFASPASSKFIAATDYASQPFVGKSVCMSQDQKVDETCKCRNTINTATKENTCLKFPANYAFNDLGNAVGGASILKSVNGLTGASYDGGNLQGSNLGKAAARNKKILDKLLEAQNKKRAAQGLGPIAYSDELATQMAGQFMTPENIALAAQNTMGGMLAASRPGQGAVADNLKKAEENAKVNPLQFDGNSQGLAKAGGPRKTADTGFSFPGGSAGNKNGETLDFMDKDYKYQNNDIVKRSDVSIWNIISQRYNQSALPRLFDDGL